MSSPKKPRRAADPPVRPPRLPLQRPGRAGGARDANRRARLSQIAEAALGLFLEQGIPAVSIDQIVDAAGVAKGSFYRYFHDKEELVGALVDPLARGVAAAFAECRDALSRAQGPDEVSGSYLALARTVAGAIVAHPRAALLYLQESRGPSSGARAPICRLADEVADRAEQLSRHACDHGLLRDLDPRVQGLVVLGAVERLLYDFLSGRRPQARADVISATVVTIILDGVRQRS
jgi:AcrR family transcriptional regulator